MANDKLSFDFVGFTKAQCLSSWVSGSSWLAMVVDSPTLELPEWRRLPDSGILVDSDRLLNPVFDHDIVLIGCLLFE
jgi:hypothetical protein